MSRRLGLTVSRAVLKLVNDASKLQGVQIALLDGEARATVERFQQYGFTGVPFPEAEALALAVGGSRSHMVVVAVDDRRYRMKGLQAGEVALYTDEGDYVLLKRGRIVEVKAGTKLRVDAPDAEFTGNVSVAGNLHVGGDTTCDGNVSDANGSMQEMRDTYNGHTHLETGGTTQTPAQEMS
jgi:phage baseplate assembly protein V